MRSKHACLICCIILAALLCSSGVLGLGITPAKERMDFSEGYSQHSLRIINNENRDLKLRIRAQGELAEYAEPDDELIVLYIGEKEKALKYSLDLPADLKPGTRTLEIAVEEIVESGEGETSIKVATEVIHTLNVVVPYPGKYAEAKMYISEANLSELVKFTVPVLNLGRQDIQEASVGIRIYEGDVLVGKTLSGTSGIESQKEGKFMVEWLADVEHAGIYRAVATIRYDNKETVLEQEFYIGDVAVEILEIDVENFNLGRVARFDILLNSRWNDDLQGVFGEMIIKDKEGEELTRYRTGQVDIAALSNATIESFWNTEDIGIGVYDVHLLLHYAGKITEEVFEVNVFMDSIITPYTPTARLISMNAASETSPLLLLLIIFLFLMNIVLVLYYRKVKSM
ncbi:hypothetical protein GF351_00175 [Candidatus Woesearchaeota archaeon]|nr:hypothetical protein [Candidatus Woesearchaeota archaeon]